MSYAVPSLQPIRDEIEREVVINAGWVDLTDQRTSKAEYVNTTGRTYEVMLRVGGTGYGVRLRHPDGTTADIPVSDNAVDLSFQLKPGESVEMLHNQYGDHIYWFERQL